MDRIFLHGLNVDCVVGVWDWERQITQRIVIDLDMSIDNRKAAATDQLEDTLNYKKVAKAVITLVENSGFQLIETMAEEIAKLVQETFGVAWIRVRINKGGAVKQVDNVGVQIERGQRD